MGKPALPRRENTRTIRARATSHNIIEWERDAMALASKRNRHVVHGTGCGCLNPILQRASRRLDSFSRRSFLSCVSTAAAVGTLGASASFAQGPREVPRTLFTRVRLFDGTSDALRPGVQILVEGNKIASVDTTNSAPPAGATIIDCGDRVMMPGMIDAHWHTLYVAVPMARLMTADPGF